MKTSRRNMLLTLITLCAATISCFGSSGTEKESESLENEELFQSTEGQNYDSKDYGVTESPTTIENPSVIWQVNHGAFPEGVNPNLYPFVGRGELKIHTDSFDHAGTRFLPVFERGYAYDDTTIYTVTPSDNPVAYGLQNGDQLWISEIEGEVIGVGQQVVFVYTSDNRVYILDKKDGTELSKIIIEG